MQHALLLAQKAEQIDEVPVGAVVVHQGKIIGEGYNQSILLNDPSAHAEMIAIRQAGQKLNNYRLLDCTLYVTLEPCQMCAGASYWAQIGKIVFGASELERGFLKLKTTIHPKTKVVSGILENECSTILKRFFIEKRNLN